ncbi:unnamed protein product (macronuclear) [Paramecium tetraurelia]|uniref:Ubiquitin-like domain-containing protein n=1 Tax=Paramecium tetraurelia TaxID=5888 RepID=A0BRQ8_PARTE|nr:uncharacterized protein GSPATT00031456001 [Paramecium tetraurelia]CAK61225.1 unnamed protein product [Paramecium tetraurelia]|eukprot:XP_001428623.1 hypothetical protein (macronuclear) [Paramecium tetraurelia strain d4-2]
MIEVTFKIDQLKINLSSTVNPQLQIVSYVRRILHPIGMDSINWENISCFVTYNNLVQDRNKTFIEAGVTDRGVLQIRLSLRISIEIVNKQLQFQDINVDAFESTQIFKDLIIRNYLRNTPYEIGIFNVQDGKQLEKDTWIQNGIGNSIPVLLNIQIKQSIKWKGEVIDINFSIFSPIYKVIQSFMYKLNINGIISFQCQNSLLKPELSYFNNNLPIDAVWQASIPNEVVYRVLYQKQSRERQIIFKKDQQIYEIIKILRKEFNITNPNKITLMYHWPLDRFATVASEAIPNFSLLKLVEEDQKGDLQIILQPIGENSHESSSIHNVRYDTSLEDLSSKIQHTQNDDVHFFLETQDSQLQPKSTLDQMNAYYGCTILYKVVQKPRPRIVTVQTQSTTKKFGVLIVNLNIVINVDIAIEKNDLEALAEVLRYKLSIPKNQIIQFSLGTRLFQENLKLEEIMGGNFEYLQALLSTNLQIKFKNNKTEQVTTLAVNLEDTLTKVSSKLKMNALYSFEGKQLGGDETFAQLRIQNNGVILYEETPTPQDQAEIINNPSVQKPLFINDKLHEPSESMSNEFTNEKKIPQQIPNQVQQDALNNSNNDQITVKASVGEKLYRCRVKGNLTCEELKKFIYDLAIQGDPLNIKQYNLLQGDQVLRDDQTISSLNQKEVEIQFRLK